jgi:hypothetical protein
MLVPSKEETTWLLTNGTHGAYVRPPPERVPSSESDLEPGTEILVTRSDIWSPEELLTCHNTSRV